MHLAQLQVQFRFVRRTVAPEKRLPIHRRRSLGESFQRINGLVVAFLQAFIVLEG
jgi:hypothetical protein